MDAASKGARGHLRYRGGLATTLEEGGEGREKGRGREECQGRGLQAWQKREVGRDGMRGGDRAETTAGEREDGEGERRQQTREGGRG